MLTGARRILLLSDHVLVRLIHPERMTHGLWIPDTAKRQAYELWKGEVVACGPGKRSGKTGRLTPCDVTPGDHVLFSWIAGKIDVSRWPDEEHRIIHESDIQGVLG